MFEINIEDERNVFDKRWILSTNSSKSIKSMSLKQPKRVTAPKELLKLYLQKLIELHNHDSEDKKKLELYNFFLKRYLSVAEASNKGMGPTKDSEGNLRMAIGHIRNGDLTINEFLTKMDEDKLLKLNQTRKKETNSSQNSTGVDNMSERVEEENFIGTINAQQQNLTESSAPHIELKGEKSRVKELQDPPKTERIDVMKATENLKRGKFFRASLSKKNAVRNTFWKLPLSERILCYQTVSYPMREERGDLTPLERTISYDQQKQLLSNAHYLSSASRKSMDDDDVPGVNGWEKGNLSTFDTSESEDELELVDAGGMRNTFVQNEAPAIARIHHDYTSYARKNSFY